MRSALVAWIFFHGDASPYFAFAIFERVSRPDRVLAAAAKAADRSLYFYMVSACDAMESLLR